MPSPSLAPLALYCSPTHDVDSRHGASGFETKKMMNPAGQVTEEEIGGLIWVVFKRS
jgi:hypothetical protein